MPRPRFHITPDDWFDALDWLEYQLSQPGWLLDDRHPVHEQGLAHLTERVHQCRYVESPTHPDCDALQTLLEQNLARSDWDRLRKTLSARRRRRRERRQAQSPVNLTLTTQAHHWLKQLTRAGSFATLSDALTETLPDMVAQLELLAQSKLKANLERALASWSDSDLLQAVKHYLEMAGSERSLATACRIAYQWYQRDPDPYKVQMLKERFVDDLVWNEIHLDKAATRFLTGVADIDGAPDISDVYRRVP